MAGSDAVCLRRLSIGVGAEETRAPNETRVISVHDVLCEPGVPL